MQVNKSINFFTPIFFATEEIEKFSLPKQFCIKIGQFADSYLSWGEDRIKITALEEVKERIPVCIKVAKVASYILSIGIFPLAALAVKAVYKKYCTNFIKKNSPPPLQEPVKVDQVNEDDKTPPLVNKVKPGHYRSHSLNDYFQKFATISEQGSDLLKKVEEYQTLQANTMHPKPGLVRRPRFRRVVKEPIEIPIQQPSNSLDSQPPPPPPMPLLSRKPSDLKAIIRANKKSLKQEHIKKILEKQDPLLTQYILQKIDILISDHKESWRKNKKDAAICFPISVEVFADVYYCAATKNIYVATQKFASGMFNEVVRGYDWKTGEEVVLRRRIPVDVHEETLIEDSKRQFMINQDINKLKIPNVIEAKGFVQVENQAIIVLEKMQGCELQDFLSADTLAFSTAQQKHLILGLISTVKKLHDVGITHGDIHPRNLFVYVEKNEIKLFDFDKTEKADDRNSQEFLSKAREDINLMGKLLFGMLFSKEFKGEEQGYQVMREKLGQPKDKNSLEAICLEMINTKFIKGQLNLSLKDLIKRLS